MSFPSGVGKIEIAGASEDLNLRWREQGLVCVRGTTALKTLLGFSVIQDLKDMFPE